MKTLRYTKDQSDIPSEAPSDRQFCLVMAGASTLIGLMSLWKHMYAYAWIWGSLALSLAFLSFIYPKLLAPLNQLWTKFGVLLHKIFNPLIMAILYYGLFMPMGLIARVLGWDPLRCHFDKHATSYWISRASMPLSTLKNQF